MIAIINPVAELDPQFSSPEASPTPWSRTRERLDKAAVYWLSTVRPDGRPHVTPLVGVWMDTALYFCTGPGERKAKNLLANPQVVLTTGCNAFSDGLDVVVEGEAVRVSDQAGLQRLADTFASNCSPPFDFSVGDGGFLNEGGREAMVYEVAPVTAFGFDKGEQFSQTRWRF